VHAVEQLVEVLCYKLDPGSSPGWGGIFNLPNPSSRIMTLVSTQPLTELSTRNLPGDKKRPALRAGNLAAICGPNVWKCGNLTSRNPKGLHGLYRDNFTLSYNLWDKTLCSPLINQPIFLLNILHPSSGSKIRERRDRHEWRSRNCSAYSSNLKKETTCSWVMSVDFQRSIKRSTSDERSLK
jgi:hypothetical protein